MLKRIALLALGIVLGCSQVGVALDCLNRFPLCASQVDTQGITLNGETITSWDNVEGGGTGTPVTSLPWDNITGAKSLPWDNVTSKPAMGSIISMNKGTLTNGKYCIYTTASGLVCNSEVGAGDNTYDSTNVNITGGIIRNVQFNQYAGEPGGDNVYFISNVYMHDPNNITSALIWGGYYKNAWIDNSSLGPQEAEINDIYYDTSSTLTAVRVTNFLDFESDSSIISAAGSLDEYQWNVTRGHFQAAGKGEYISPVWSFRVNTDNDALLPQHVLWAIMSGPEIQGSSDFLVGVYGDKKWRSPYGLITGPITLDGQTITSWGEIAGGDDLGDASASDVIALFGTGTCSGYLKSDGTCDTPTGSGDYDPDNVAITGGTITGITSMTADEYNSTCNPANNDCYHESANSGDLAASWLKAGRSWFNSTSNLLKIRNSDNTANLTFYPSGTMTNGKLCVYTTGTGIVCNTDAAGGMVYPGAGIPNSTGSAWGTSYSLDTDLSSVSASDDTIPSAKATKAAIDLKPGYPAAGIPQSAGSAWSSSLSLDTDLTSVSGSDDSVPSAKATKAALDLKLNSASAMTDSTTNTLTNKTYDPAATGNVFTFYNQKDFTILDPVAADNSMLFKARNAMTVSDIHCLAQGGGTITLQILECDSAGANCAGLDGASTITCDSDGAEDDGSLSNGSIDAGDWVQVLYGAPSGTVNTLTYSIYYSEAQ
jgi:hypothetical protein